MTDNTTDFFDGIGQGVGAPSALLKNPGDFVMGPIVEFFKRDYIPFGKTDPELKEDGSKRQQLVIIVQTEHRNWANVVKVPKQDPNDANSPEKAPSEDDGKRAIYVPEGSNIQYAVARALGAAKAKFELGGTIGVKVFNLKDTGKGNPLKEHEAVYKVPSAASGFFQETPAAAAPATPPQAAAPAPAPAAPAPAPTPAPAAPAQQDPWATTNSAPAPAGDPWATPAAPAGNQPPF